MIRSYIVKERSIGAQRHQFLDRARHLVLAGKVQCRFLDVVRCLLCDLRVENAGLLGRLHQQCSRDLVLIQARNYEGCSPILHKYTHACVSE
jgi:hypothetical protein